MYSTCLFCHGPLGSNEHLESFQVGNKLAFDGARGRLWVVCPGCSRWNLTALEERWEAMEECERLFRDSGRRVSTDNIGLAFVRGGLQLVRVGQPLRPEFAAWRYGSELVSRRSQDISNGVAVGAGSLVALAGGAVFGGVTLGVAGAAMAPVLFVGGAVAVVRAMARKVVAQASLPGGETALVRVRDLNSVHFHGADSAEGMRLTVDSTAGRVELAAAPAFRLASVACARRNQIGGTKSVVSAAAGQIEALGGPERVLARASETGALERIRYIDRLALEMALHEDAERRALEGELEELETAWREAEEIAAIADSLLLPAAVNDFVRRVRGTPAAVPRGE